MAKLSRVNYKSLSFLLAVAFAILGAIAGVLYAFGGLFIDLILNGEINEGTGLAFLALPIMPALGALVGFILGVILSALYNIYAKLFGGIDINLGR